MLSAIFLPIIFAGEIHFSSLPDCFLFLLQFLLQTFLPQQEEQMISNGSEVSALAIKKPQQRLRNTY